MITDSRTNRRAFLSTLAGTAASLATLQAADAPKLKLGFDNFSVRSRGMKAPALLDYAASLKVDALLLSDLDVYEKLDDGYLQDIGKKARDLGIELHAGTGSLCDGSRMFNKKHGKAVEHAQLLVRVAKALGTKVARCYLGGGDDRKSEGGLPARMKEMSATLKAVASQARDAGVKFAVENHAGDMQAWELAQLVEETGKDFVGVTVDTGNAAWTLEDPAANFEILAPYSVSAGIRDNMLWESPQGTTVQWCAMGEGCVDFAGIFSRWAQVIPEVPVVLEIISGLQRSFDWQKPDFWPPYERTRPQDFAKFLTLAKKGKPMQAGPGWNAPEQADYQKAELEKSLRTCREKFGIGRKG